MKGYKTYIVGFLLIVAAGCHSLGYISSELFTTIATLLGGTGLITLRAGVKKLE